MTEEIFTIARALVSPTEAEEGVLRLLVKDASVFPDAPPLTEEQFSSPLLARAFTQLWQMRAAGRDPSVPLLAAVEGLSDGAAQWFKCHTFFICTTVINRWCKKCCHTLPNGWITLYLVRTTDLFAVRKTAGGVLAIGRRRSWSYRRSL